MLLASCAGDDPTDWTPAPASTVAQPPATVVDPPVMPPASPPPTPEGVPAAPGDEVATRAATGEQVVFTTGARAVRFDGPARRFTESKYGITSTVLTTTWVHLLPVEFDGIVDETDVAWLEARVAGNTAGVADVLAYAVDYVDGLADRGPSSECWTMRVLARFLPLVAAVGCTRGAPAPRRPPAADTRAPYHVVAAWPALEPGTTTGQVSGVALDADEHVWIFHRADHSWLGPPAPSSLIARPTLLELDRSSGAILKQVGGDRFIIPHGLYIDQRGHLWVTDVGAHVVVELDAAGEHVRTLGTPGVPGADGSHFNRPTDVVRGPDGTLFVADGYVNTRIAVFDASGRYVREWGGAGSMPGQLDTPHSIARGADGRLYVADRGNRRVQVFSPAGELLGIWQSEELGRPWAVAVAPDGACYVLDGGDQPQAPPDRAKAMRVDCADGRVLESWGSHGHEPGQLDWPHDLAVSRADEVFIGEVHRGNRVQKFDRHASAPPTR